MKLLTSSYIPVSGKSHEKITENAAEMSENKRSQWKARTSYNQFAKSKLHAHFIRTKLIFKVGRKSSPLTGIRFLLSSLLSLSWLFFACTEDEKTIPPPEIYLANNGQEIEVNLGDTISLQPKITYNFDASYEWRKNNVPLEHTGQFLLDTASTLGSIEYFFKVTTPYGSDSMMIPVDVIILADFNNLALSTQVDTFWIGANNQEGFTHKDLFFPNQYTNDTIWEGFGYSNMGNKSTVIENIEPYSVYAIQDKEDYFTLVRIPNKAELPTPTFHFKDDRNHILKSLEVNNTTRGHYWMDFGTDEFERMGGQGSEKPDWFKLTITGINANGEMTSSIEFFLADYRFDNNKRDYIVSEWTTIELRELGPVNKIQISVSSSKTNINGDMITPEMFCIDNLKILN
jgi:hypothetical protein